jgi:HK97 family phage major capsid protein
MDAVELRRLKAELIAEVKTLNEADELSEEQRTQYDAKMKEVDNLNERIQRAERLALEEADVRSVAQFQSPKLNLKTRRGDTEERAIGHYIRTGDASGLEQRASNATDMNIGTAADGGNTVPTGHYQGIIARRDEDMLSAKLGAMRIPGVGTTVNVPIDDEADGEFITKGEATAFDQDAPALGTVAMTLVKYTKTIEISDELLQDEDANLMAFLNNWIGRAMAKTYNQLFIAECKAGGTAALSLASATVIAATEIPALVYKLQAEYTDKAAWIMSRTVEGEVFGLASTSDWQFANKSMGDASSRSLWSFPVYNSAYCTETVASSKSLILGNFSFIGWRDGGIQFLRNPYLYGRQGQVSMHYYFRTVYKTLQAEAIVYATHPTA